jgi:cell division protein FtsB
MSAGKKILKIHRRIFLNKYTLVFLIFAGYVTFFDKHNLISRWKIYQRNKELEKEMKYYDEKIKSDRTKLFELKSSNENLEKFAREHYFYKKDNEDVFIIKKDSINTEKN